MRSSDWATHPDAGTIGDAAVSELRLSGVSKVYPNGLRAVSDVNLDIADGELLVLVGPSGCGKSTLLRMIAGLEDITEGTVEIDGREVNAETPRERDIAMVFQNYALYPHMTVRKNIGYSLRLGRVPKDEASRRVEDTAAMLELTDLLDRKPGALSGGQRQRVGHGTGHRPQAGRVLDGRAAVEPRRPAAGFRCGPRSSGCSAASEPRPST